MTLLSSRSLPILVLLLSACGSPPPPAEPAAPPPAAAPSAAPSAEAPPATSAAAPAPAAPAPSAEAPKEEEAALSKSVGERLLAPTMSYMLNYAASGAHDKTAAACEAASGDDPAKKAACISKERDKLVSDVLVFEKTGKGTFWTIYKRSGSTLAEVWKGPIELSADSPERVTVKILKAEKEKGYRQLFAGKKELTIASASDSSIELDDPQFGKLVYEARIGLVERHDQ
ncbi:MAG TPA: hypothetical protein VHE30_02485 [Polyangiaceae bacterium]|nr:hypothetical protein [Polyangiaceae bacterium]